MSCSVEVGGANDLHTCNPNPESLEKGQHVSLLSLPACHFSLPACHFACQLCNSEIVTNAQPGLP